MMKTGGIIRKVDVMVWVVLAHYGKLLCGFMIPFYSKGK